MYNKVILIGKLAADTENRILEDAQKVFTFPLMIDVKSSSPKVVDFHKIEGDGEVNFVKGQIVSVEGALRNRSYEDKDGNRRFMTVIDAKPEDIELFKN